MSPVDHPDWLRLNEVITELDWSAWVANPFVIVDVDEASFMVMAQARVQGMVDRISPITTENLGSALIALYLDAFALGQAFERAGGSCQRTLRSPHERA